MDDREAWTDDRKPVKKKKTKRRPLSFTLRAVLAGLVSLALIALGVWAVLSRDRLSSENLRETFGRGSEQTSANEPFTYEVGTGQVFSSAGNGFAVASSSALEYLDRDGRKLFKQLVSYSRPTAIGSENGVLFCDLGTEKLVWLDADGNRKMLEPSAEIQTASLNQHGWLALTTGAAGYKSLVTVYDDQGKRVYEWWSGTGYVLSARVSPDNKLLAVACAEIGGGQVHAFRLDSEEEVFESYFPDELPFDLGFLGNDSICAISEDAMTFLSASGEIRERFVFGDYYLMDYEYGESFAAVYVSPYRSGGGGYLESFNVSGELLGVAEQERDVLSLSAAGRQLLVMTGGGWTVCNAELHSQRSREGLLTAKSALLREDGNVLLLGSYQAERVR